MNQWSPEQFWPSPVKPVLHVQLKLPLVLLHSALLLQLWIPSAHSSISEITLGKRLWCRFLLELLLFMFYFFWRLSTLFMKCVSGDNRSPTSPRYGQFVEGKTTEKKVILLFLQTQPTDSNNGFKKVILCQ